LRRQGAQSLQITLHEPNQIAATVLQPFVASHVDYKVWTLGVAPERLPEVLELLIRHGIAFERVQYGISRLEKIYLGLLLGSSEKPEAAA
jgi:hypothetical protein